MPAALPQSPGIKNSLLIADQYPVNPSVGQAAIMDALSGTKGSPLDKDNAAATINLPAGGTITWQANCTTGAMSTGIGFGLNVVVAPGNLFSTTKGPGGGFTDDVGAGGAIANSTAVYLGGGRSVVTNGANPAGVAGTNPYTAGFLPVSAGNGGNRDAGAGPAFTGFVSKMVTATAGVAIGGVVETGFVNRSGVALLTGESTLGSATAAQAAAS
jgi:hypothetical protein